MTVLATSKWATNADLIADCATLGYLRPGWRTLDPTYGYGTFWQKWQPYPGLLVACDLEKGKSPLGYGVDFRDLPWEDGAFDCVVFDPPYKLNGTPDEVVDERYGVETPRTWQERMELCRAGIKECARVYNGKGYFLVKCQDQVSSGKVRWQTIDFTAAAEECGLGLVDRFDFLGGRPQPEGRRQVHARRNSSQLLVFKSGWRWRP